MEKPVKFKVGNNYIFGILHFPPKQVRSKKKSGIIFITAGLRYRIGPYRQYVRFARRFCLAGFHILRCDYSGIGDSGGYFKDLFEYRQYVVEDIDKTDKVVRFFIAETGVEQLGLFGICGGAYDALVTGAANLQVKFAVLLSLPVELLDNSMPEGMGQFDRHPHWRSLYEESSKAIDTYIAHEKKALFIFGEHDPFYQAFVGRFGQKLSNQNVSKSLIDIQVVKNADHVFSKIHWQNAAIEKSMKWLEQFRSP